MTKQGQKIRALYLTTIILFSFLIAAPVMIMPVAAAGNVTATTGAYQFADLGQVNEGSAQVVSSQVSVIAGTNAGNSGDLLLETKTPSGSDRVDINLWYDVDGDDQVDSGDTQDLTNGGYDKTSAFEIEVELANYRPYVLMFAGNLSDTRGWNTTYNSSTGNVNATMTVTPIEIDENASITPGTESFDGSYTTDNHWDARVSMSLWNLSGIPDSHKPELNGTTILTDAQDRRFPSYVPPTNPNGPSLDTFVGAPHLNASGSINDGFYEAFLPNGLLSAWGEPTMSEFNGTVTGDLSLNDSSFTEVRRGNNRIGVLANLSYNYSEGTLSVDTSGGTNTYINGTVQDSGGASVSGTTVEFQFNQSGNAAGTTTTDGNGDYSFEVPDTNKRYDVIINNQNYVLTINNNNSVTNDQTTTVDFSLQEGGLINGTVTDSNGDPVNNLRVEAYTDPSGSFARSGRTDSNGNYSLRVRETRNYEIVINSNDYDLVIKPGISVTAAQTTTVDIQVSKLAGTGYINGSVVDPDGNGVQNANIFAADASFKDFGTNRTDSNGNFSIEVRAGQYSVRADTSNYPTAKREGVSVSENQTTNLSFQLQEAAEINGIVTNSTGAAPSGAVALIDTPAGVQADPVDTSTGYYNITVPPGTYTVSILAEGETAPSKQATVTGGGVNQTNFELRNATIVHQSVEITDGPGIESNIELRSRLSAGFLQLQVVDQNDSIPQGSLGAPSELKTVGANESTKFRMNITVTNFSANSLLWGLDNARWNTSENASVKNGTDITITGSPTTMQVNFNVRKNSNLKQTIGPVTQQDPSNIQWPTGRNDRATAGRNQTVFLGLFDLSSVPPDLRNSLRGMSVTTNAQVFSIPSVENDTLQVWVGAPTATVDGVDHNGFYQAEIPQSQLDEWGVSDPQSDLNALYKGDSANFTVTDTAEGARIRIDNISYSAGFVEVQAVPEASTGGSSSDSDSESTQAKKKSSSRKPRLPPEVPADARVPDVVEEVQSGAVGEPGTAASRVKATIENVNSEQDVAVVIPEDSEGAKAVEEETGTRVSAVDFKPAGSGTADIEISSSRDPPDDTPDLESSVANARSLSYTSVDVSIRGPAASRQTFSLSDVFSANFTFEGRKSRVAALTGFPENIVMYHYSAEKWRAIPTRQINETDSHYVFRARSAGFSVFAIAVQDPEFSVESPTLSRSDISPGDAITVAADIQNSGNGKETFTAELTIDGETVDKQAVIVDAGESEEVSFTHQFTQEGEFDIAVSGVSAGTVRAATPTPSPTPPDSPTPTATPAPPPTPTPDMTPTAAETPRVTASPPETDAPGLDGFGFGVGLIALITIALIAARRSD